MNPVAYLQTVSSLKSLTATNQVSIDAFKKEKQKVEFEYTQKIRDLENQKSKALSEIEEKIKELQNLNSVNHLRETRKEYEEIFKLIQYKETNPLKIDTHIVPIIRNNVYCEDLGVLFQDDYLYLKAYIIRNDKPTKKYSLVLFGWSYFNRKLELTFYPNDCPKNVYFNENRPSFNKIVKDASTVEELKYYFNKRKNELSQLIDLRNHFQLVEKYKWMLSECNTKEWVNAYLLHRKEYFEKYYGYGHKTNSEYLDILKRLEKYSYSNL